MLFRSSKLLITAIIAVALGVGSYLYFVNSKPALPPIPKFDNKLVGSWKVDSAYNNADSNKLSLLIAYMFKDSATIKFNPDSTLQVISNNVEDKQNYYVKSDSLFVKDDSTYTVMTIKAFTDSSFELVNKDSTVVVYSRIK